MCPARTCNLRLKTPRIFHSFGLGGKISTVMEKKAGKSQRERFLDSQLLGAGEPALTNVVRPTPGQGSKGDVSGSVLRLPAWAFHDHGSGQRWQLPAGGSPITPPPGVLPRNHSSLAGRATTGCWAGKEVQLSLLCHPGVNRWVMDLPLPYNK